MFVLAVYTQGRVMGASGSRHVRGADRLTARRIAVRPQRHLSGLEEQIRPGPPKVGAGHLRDRLHFGGGGEIWRRCGKGRKDKKPDEQSFRP